MKKGYYITTKNKKVELSPPTKENTLLSVSNKNITELVVPEGYKEVWCSYNQLTSLVLPNGIRAVWCDISVKLINLNEEETEAILYANK